MQLVTMRELGTPSLTFPTRELHAGEQRWEETVQNHTLQPKFLIKNNNWDTV